MPAFSDFLEVQSRTLWGRTLAEFTDFCAPTPASLALDIGCGPGLLPALLKQRRCIPLGMDLDLDLLRTRLSDGLCQADAFHLPFPARSVDIITATNVLFLLDDPAAALLEWKRVLKISGTICLLNPSELLSVDAAAGIAGNRRLEGIARESLLGWARNAEIHARWTELATRDLLDSAGLELVESVLRIGPGFARLSRAGKPKRSNNHVKSGATGQDSGTL